MVIITLVLTSLVNLVGLAIPTTRQKVVSITTREHGIMAVVKAVKADRIRLNLMESLTQRVQGGLMDLLTILALATRTLARSKEVEVEVVQVHHHQIRTALPY